MFFCLFGWLVGWFLLFPSFSQRVFLCFLGGGVRGWKVGCGGGGGFVVCLVFSTSVACRPMTPLLYLPFSPFSCLLPCLYIWLLLFVLSLLVCLFAFLFVCFYFLGFVFYLFLTSSFWGWGGWGVFVCFLFHFVWFLFFMGCIFHFVFCLFFVFRGWGVGWSFFCFFNLNCIKFSTVFFSGFFFFFFFFFPFFLFFFFPF